MDDRDDRDTLGKIVRDAWIAWARAQPDPKPSWLVPYEELAEPDKEADRQIAEAVAEAVLADLNARRIGLALKKNRGGLTPAEAEEFAALQEGYFAALDHQLPRPPLDPARLDAIEARLDRGDEGKIRAPFTPGQVAALNAYQAAGTMHPFTCGADGCGSVLVATADGWHCPRRGCEYRQDWAHGFMAVPAAE